MLAPIILMLVPIVLHTCLHNEGNLECFDIMKLSIRKLCVHPSCEISKMYPSLCSQVSPTHPPTHLPTYLPTCLPTCLPTYLPTYLPTQANSSSVSQIPHFVWNWNVHYRVHNSPPLVPIVSQLYPVHTPILFLHTLILSFHPHLGLPTVLFASGFPTKTLYEPVLSPNVPHASTISFFLVSSPRQYLVMSTNLEAGHYAVSTTPLVPRPS